MEGVAALAGVSKARCCRAAALGISADVVAVLVATPYCLWQDGVQDGVQVKSGSTTHVNHGAARSGGSEAHGIAR
jgi:hypothetical protein